MLQFLQPYLPLLAPLVLGGAFLTFLLKRLERRDQVSDRNFLGDQEIGERARFYETSYNKADAHSRSLTQIIGPLALAWYEGKDITPWMEIVKMAILFEDEKGKLQLKAHPNFIEQTRAEWDALNGENHGE